MKYYDLEQLLGQDEDNLLGYKSKTLSKDLLHIRSSDFVDKIFAIKNGNLQVLRSLSTLYDHGRLR